MLVAGPWTSENTPAGRPASATAPAIAPADQLGGARVGGWALTTTGQPAASAEAVSPPATGEGEREVAGAEDRDRAERHLPLPDVGARQRRAVRQRRVDADAEVVALADDAGEQPQLAGGAAELAGEPARGQPGLA